MEQSDWQEMPQMDLGEGRAVTGMHVPPHLRLIQQELERQRSEAITWKARYLHLYGNLEKTRKRVEHNAVRRIQHEKEKMLLDFLSFVDDLERVVAKRGGLGEQERNRDGLGLVLHELHKTLASYGVEKIEALNQPYDPHFHEARGCAYNQGFEPGTVIQVIQNGYMCKPHLLRSAEVLVSA